MPVSSVFRRLQPRRGGGGVERGGDACIALAGVALSHRGRCKHPHPAPLLPRPYAIQATPKWIPPQKLPLRSPWGREGGKGPPAGSLFPFITRSIVPGLRGCQMYTACHTCTEPSPLAEAMCFPSGNHTTAYTESVCARKVSTLACG